MQRAETSWARTSIVDQPGSLRITLRVRRNFFVVGLLAIWLTVWAAVEATLVLALAGNEVAWLREFSPEPGHLALFTLAFTLTGLFVAWRLLWNLAGREVLFLSPTLFALRREIAGLGRTRHLDLGRIRRLRVGTVNDNPVYPSLGRMFIGKGTCFLAFDYDNRTHRFARGLTQAESTYLVETVRHWIDAQ